MDFFVAEERKVGFDTFEKIVKIVIARARSLFFDTFARFALEFYDTIL